VEFGTVIIVITLLAIVAAVASMFFGGPSPYESIGRGDLTFDEPDFQARPPPGSAAARAESEAEIRQMLEAKSDRRERRGEEPLDIDAELAALTRPASTEQDPALREEVRQVVVARNERRVARGEEPLDVEAEVDRQLRDLGG
jgi:hypothetical protein